MSYRDSPYVRPRMRELIRGFWRCMGHGAVGYGPSMQDAYTQWLERRAAYAFAGRAFDPKDAVPGTLIQTSPHSQTWQLKRGPFYRRLLELISRGSTNSAGPGGRPTRV